MTTPTSRTGPSSPAPTPDLRWSERGGVLSWWAFVVAELFLFAASRRQNVVEVIKPALDRGGIVLCDRFTDSTLAYQGFGRLLDLDRLRMLNDWATSSLRPDVTLLFDIDEASGLSRARSRNANAPHDEGRFEAEELRFHRRVREGYLALAVAEPRRFVVVDGAGTIDEVFARMMNKLPPQVAA